MEIYSQSSLQLDKNFKDTPETLDIKDIRSLRRESDATRIIQQIARIEKRTFPTSEAFEFNISLWRKKPNTRVLYGASLASGDDTSCSENVIAYAVYTRIKGTGLLHKVCIAEPYRGRGLGKALMKQIEQRLRVELCQSVHLWVDRKREAARRLYLGCGFVEREVVEDYYGPGRTGVKMVLDLDPF